MSICGIYKIQSAEKPDRFYIGSSKDIGERFRLHLVHLKKNDHHSIKLQNHYNKYGKSDLLFYILLGCEKEDLIKNEQYFLDSYKPWFNMAKVAGSGEGHTVSEEARKIMSEKRKGTKNPHVGHRPSEEGIQRIKDKLRGRIPWNKGKPNPHGGYIFTEDHKKNIGEAQRGRKHSPETKKKMSEWRKEYYRKKEEQLIDISAN